MFTMYDSVNLSQIPAQPHAVASYIDGRYANYEEAVKRFPHARHLSISTSGGRVADCYDIENGDYRPEQAGELYKLAAGKNVWRPCFYANLSTMPTVLKALAGIHRSQVRLWVAYYNGSSDLPGTYDAHQFTDHALGRNLDESICADTFFPPAKPAKAETETVPAARVTFDPDTGSWTIESLPFAQVAA